jgi:hypothetical protein
MYDIEATVRIVATIEVILGGNCPLSWLHAQGIRSTEIVRKLSPDEIISAVQEQTEWSCRRSNQNQPVMVELKPATFYV